MESTLGSSVHRMAQDFGILGLRIVDNRVYTAELVQRYPRIATVSVHPDVTATTLVGNSSLLSSEVMIHLTDLSEDKSYAAEIVQNQP